MGSNTNGGKEKILIVDSNADNVALLEKIISPHYPVISASPDDAFNVLSNLYSGIAAAVIGIRHAISIVKQVRGYIPVSKFPVLISTDIDNSELENELLNLEVIDFLKAPYDEPAEDSCKAGRSK